MYLQAIHGLIIKTYAYKHKIYKTQNMKNVHTIQAQPTNIRHIHYIQIYIYTRLQNPTHLNNNIQTYATHTNLYEHIQLI